MVSILDCTSASTNSDLVLSSRWNSSCVSSISLFVWWYKLSIVSECTMVRRLWTRTITVQLTITNNITTSQQYYASTTSKTNHLSNWWWAGDVDSITALWLLTKKRRGLFFRIHLWKTHQNLSHRRTILHTIFNFWNTDNI